jgi:hypothetical protein
VKRDMDDDGGSQHGEGKDRAGAMRCGRLMGMRNLALVNIV